MAYYGAGGGPPPPQYNQGPVPPQGLGPMFAGPQGHGQQHPSGMYEQYPGMYQGGGPPPHGYGYDGQQQNVHPPGYGGQEYYNQQAPMHGYSNHGDGGMGQASEQYYPRPHINPNFLPPENPPVAQEKPTKILRNPYPTITKEEIRSQQKDEIYDPSNPTLSTAANSNNNAGGSRNTMDNSQSAMGYHQRQNQPQNQQQPPMFHQQMPQHSQAPQQPQPQYHQSTPAAVSQHSQAPQHQYHQSTPAAVTQHSQAPQHQYHQSTPSATSQHQQPMAAPNVPPRMSMFENMSTPNYNSAQSQQMSHRPNDATRKEQPDSGGKMQVMTGLVTHISPGAFGMISDEIFFQEGCVSGPKPKVGDKVVVEAEPVKGMPFKYNAKKVTKLDADLVRDDNAQNRSTPTSTNAAMQQPQRRYDRPEFGPLPTMPESLNLPRPFHPPNLSSMIPSNSQPLKSILKRKGSPPMKRNPPPPPVISKAGVLDNLKPASASSFKPGVFAMDLDRDVHRMFNASNPGPPIEFTEYTYVRDDHPLAINPEPIRNMSPRITRLLPSSPIRERDYADYGGRPHVISPERRRGASPIVNDIFEQRRDQSPTFRNKSRSKSPMRDSVRRRSVSPKKKSRRSTSRSKSPRDRRSRRSRSKSGSPKRSKHPSPRSNRVARSPPSPRNRRRSRSASPRSRRRSRSTSTRSRRRSRSVTPRSRRRVSRSPNRRRSTSRSKQTRHSRRSSRSKSKSPSRRRRSKSSVRSASPTPSSSRRNVSAAAGSHGIHVKTVSSNLYPTVVDRGDGTLVLSSAGIPSTAASKSTPVPIKFQIANPPKPQTLVPNPTFKGLPVGQQNTSYGQNPVFSITNHTATQGNADTKRKKPKEQEPAFRVVEVEVKVPEKPQNKGVNKSAADDKIKQWEAERQALKSKVVTELTSDNLLKNPVKVLQLKQTIQNDLHELRSKENNSNVGVKLLENPRTIQQLRQTVERDLQELRNKEMPPSEKTDPTQKSSLNIQQLKSSVQQGLKELRTKFDSQAPVPKAPSQSTENRPGPSSGSKPTANNDNKAPAAKGAGNGVTIPIRTVRNSNSSERAKNPKNSTPLPPVPPAPENDEEMERIKEDIHRQRFLEEEHRLRSLGDQRALKQLYYMEDRRQRRLEERHLARIRMKEIKLKKDKNFGDLKKLRDDFGPPSERLIHERELRQARMEEEMQESQLHGQAEAIRRQEIEYQSWLEEEAHARRDAERSSRGFEGRVKRRRTPSPTMHPHNQGPPPHMQHGRSRRRSRSASYERYRDDYSRRPHRSRSREMEYDQFVMAHGGMHMPHPMDGPGFHPQHPHYGGPPPGYGHGPPPGHFEQEGFYISRAMDNVSRREDEIMQQEMEIEQRMEMAGRRMGGHPPPGYGHPPHHPHHDDGEYGRFVVRRR